MPDDGLPFARPSKIVCVGLNYRDHAEESGMEIPARPLLFAKWPSSLIGPGRPILIPEQATDVDYEAELGVVIGKRAQNVPLADALDYVAGYCCANEVSARDIQFADGQWTRGKSFDTFGPVGPIVPADQVPDPQALQIRCLLNGEVVQDSSTAQMIFTVAEVIAFISDGITLEPGDLILTGTPAGVGLGRKPPVYLADGDEVTIEIEKRRLADESRATEALIPSSVRRRGQLYIAAAAVAWSTAGGLQRELSVDTPTQLAGRALFAFVALLVFVAIRNRGQHDHRVPLDGDRRSRRRRSAPRSRRARSSSR